MKYTNNNGSILSVISTTKGKVLFSIIKNDKIVKTKNLSAKQFENFVNNNNYTLLPLSILNDVYEELELPDLNINPILSA